MYTYKIGICDDEPVFCKRLKELLNDYQKENEIQLVLKIFHSGEGLLKSFKDEVSPYQILMLDVEMPNGMSGVEVAKEIRKKNPDVGILFITNYESYALDAFKVEAVDYIVKPLDYETLKRVMAKMIIHVDYILDYKRAKKQYIQIIMDYDRIDLEVNRILYIEKRRNQSIIHTEDETYSCYETLAQIYERLNQNRFIYVHQGFIVQFSKIKEVGRDYVSFAGHIRVPVSRKYQKEVQERFYDRIYRLREQKLKEEAKIPKRY